MVLREFKNKVFEALQPAVRGTGFSVQASQERIVRRPAKGVTQLVQLAISPSHPFACVDAHLGVRLDVVENIFHRTSGFEPRFQKGTPTMGGSLADIMGRPDLRLLLDERSGPQLVRDRLFAPEMLDFYEEWFRRFSSLEGIDRELNDDPLYETPNRDMPWLRCATGAIVAHLCQRANYAEIVECYRDVLKEFSQGFYLSRFDLLLADLAGGVAQGNGWRCEGA